MSEYRDALQPLTQSSSTAVQQSTRIFRELAPQLLHPRILSSPAFLNAPSSSSSSSSSTSSSLISLSNPQNAFIALASLRNSRLISYPGASSSSSSAGYKGKSTTNGPRTSTDLRILEGVDRLLSLPIPSTSSLLGLPAVPEEGDEEEQEEGMAVGLLQGFNATIPSASSRKTLRRRRRAGISERALGITPGAKNELGLRDRAASKQGGGGLLMPNDEFVLESVESTPRRRTIKAKRRSSFMPSALSSQHQQQQRQRSSLEATQEEQEQESIETLTRPELETELSEIKLDKEALIVRRKLVIKDLGDLEERIKRLELIRLELGERLLGLKEEELELDDEFEGVTDRLSQLEALTSGKVVSSTSSRRRKGPAFLPSEHDDLPPNVAFMSMSSSSSSSSSSSAVQSILALDFSEPYGLLVASSSSTSNDSQSAVTVFDLSDGEQLAHLNGHKGIVKCLLVEGDLCITGGRDGKIALWDLPTAVEEGMEMEREMERHSSISNSKKRREDEGRVGKKQRPTMGRRDQSIREEEEVDENDVFVVSPGEVGKKASVNGRIAEMEDEVPDERKADKVAGEEQEEEEEWPLLPSPGAALRQYRTMQMQQQSQQPAPAQSSPSQHSNVTEEDYFDSTPQPPPVSSSRLRVLEGHSKDVTCISYEDNSLVSGSSDKTLRLWDLNTGQCVVTMDILWAISNPLPVELEGGEGQEVMDGMGPSASNNAAVGGDSFSSPAKDSSGAYPWNTNASYMTPRTKRSSLSGLRRLSSTYGLSSISGSPTTPTGSTPSNYLPPMATPSLFPESSWDTSYTDFVGGIQLWSYALASGSADGCVRMWDTRTGQSVRSLIGHTAAVTCLQFDNFHLISGSLDSSVRMWDLRTGRTIDTLRYEGGVTDLQFDTRRIMVANKGTNAVNVYNRTTLQQTELLANGHGAPVNKLRFMDRYLATGGMDGMVKVWSLN